MMDAVHELIEKAIVLSNSEPDETKPYDHKYEAVKLIQQALDNLENTGSSPDREEKVADHDAQAQAHATALLSARRGLILLETDLGADGEPAIESSLVYLESRFEDNQAAPDKDKHLALLLECYNALGALKSGQGDFPGAFKWLAKAQEVYSVHRGGGGLGGGDKTSSSPPTTWDEVEGQHTSTLFYLAQVHAHDQKSGLSARYCAATLLRQLEGGKYSLNEWVQNCCQLAGYYTSVRAFAVSEHYLSAAEEVGRRGKTPLEPDIEANIHLAWAKLHMQRIVTSSENHVDHNPDAEKMPTLDSLPDLMIFTSLIGGDGGVPDPRALPWGEASLAPNFEAAREVFNEGMVRFKKALDYYQLEGWVTEHCNIVFEISNMFRCLAGFEPDPTRRRLMHKQRMTRLEPLHGALSHDYYLGLSRSVSLELANICREMMDLEELEKRSAAKVAVTRREAVKYYSAFIDTYRDEDGSLPQKRIQDEGSERYFLLALFSLGRCLSGRAMDKDVEGMVKGCEQLRWAADYVDKHGISEFRREREMSLEMAKLITEKIELTKRIESNHL